MLTELIYFDAAEVSGALSAALQQDCSDALARVCGRWAYLGRIWPSLIRQVIEVA